MNILLNASKCPGASLARVDAQDCGDDININSSDDGSGKHKVEKE